MSGNTVSPSDYTGTTRLPDALAFVKPNRTECWLTLFEADEALTASQLASETGYSEATAYRALNDLDEYDLVEQILHLGATGPKNAYRTRIPANGGVDQ